MSDPGIPHPSKLRLDGALGAALGCAALGLLVLALRPPLPIDETRYLEVARELGSGNPLLLTLEGRPYSHKPPLAFWIAQLLTLAGLPLELALRALPALATAASALAVERVCRRAGRAGAAWIFAGMLLPALYVQALLVDPLLCACLWWALEAWSAERDARATLLGALAFLAKGPVAALILLPFCWALAPLRSRANPWRGLTIALAGAVPLAAWALYSARVGGDAFARELLVEQTKGRLVHSFAHARSPLIYVATLTLGSLPFLPVLILGLPKGPLRRLPAAIALVAASFALISGKQPHYLLPLFPALALWGADLWACDARARARAGRAALLIALVLLVGVAAAPWAAPAFLGPEEAAAITASRSTPGMLSLWLAGLFACALAVTELRRRGGSAARTSALTLLALAGAAAPAHALAGRLVFPSEFRRALAEIGEAPLASYRASLNGLFNYLAARDRVDVLWTPSELAAWCDANPNGFVVLPDEHAAEAPSALARTGIRDRIRGRGYELRRVATFGPTGG